MSATTIHQGPAYELSVALDVSRYGYHLSFVSFVPIARHPEHQVRFQAHLSRDALEVLHQAIGQALRQRAVRTSRSVSEPVRP